MIIDFDAILRKRSLFSLLSWLGDDKQAMIHASWQASNVASLPGTCAFLKVVHNAPTIGISAYRNTRSETQAPGKKTWWLLALVAPFRLLHFLATRKTLLWLIAESNSKKQEKQPKPEKPKPEKPKPDRKDDKGSRRVKRPKV